MLSPTWWQLDHVILYSRYEQRIAQIRDLADPALLQGSRIGLEKETLRVNPAGSMAQTEHPKAFGSALTNPYITTDYSEALLELITPPCDTINEALAFLSDTQKFVYDRLDDEILWSTSMPCVVAGETSIPIAQYGTSNAGRMKTVYRNGLGYRYGRVMQVIAGVHYNYSLSDDFWKVFQRIEADEQPTQDFINERYFGMLRNLQRLGWLVPYLFGASPAVCKSFLGGAETTLQDFDENTYYEPYATSLRMGDIGYQNNKENETGIKANYDSLDDYLASLECAITTPCPEYEKIGVKVDGEYRQLNANILQIENEYYSTVRPKQVPDGNEKPVVALQKRGVQYIELRSLDVNAFDPLGVNETQLYFLEAFMLCCLFMDSPPINDLERVAIDQNELDTAHRGRDPELTLQRNGERVGLAVWAEEVLSRMQDVCDLLDTSVEGTPYSDALQVQLTSVRDPESTPSARMLAEMRERGEGFYHFAKRMSLQHSGYFANTAISQQGSRLHEEHAVSSLLRQKNIENTETLDFDAYLQAYFEQA